MMKRKVIHMKEAIRLLESGDLCDIKVWKLSTGDIIEYKGVQCIGSHWRGGCHRIKLSVSGQIREFRDITMFNFNGMEVYL